MKLLIDLNLSPRWVPVLQAAGLNALHWSEVGHLNAADSEIMAYAAANGLVVLTQDLDFGAILATTQGSGPSVVQVRADDIRPEAIASHVIAAILQMDEALTQGALVAVEPARTRVRLLPLRR